MKIDDPIRFLMNPALFIGGKALDLPAEDVYQRIKNRWRPLLAWDVERKAPETAPMVRSWREFSDRWEGLFSRRDPDGLREQAINLQATEGNAQLHGYSNPPEVPALTPEQQRGKGAAPSAPPMVGPTGPDAIHPVKAAAATVVDKIPSPIPQGTDPLMVPKMLGVGALAAGTIAATVTAKSDAARVGIAVGGLAASALIAWGLFSPPAQGGKGS